MGSLGKYSVGYIPVNMLFDDVLTGWTSTIVDPLDTVERIYEDVTQTFCDSDWTDPRR